MQHQRAEPPALLNGHEAARRFFAPCFAASDRALERLWVAHIDNEARCLHLESYMGDPSSVGLPVRQIVADAVRLGSAGVVLAHNHPAGDASPSHADLRGTRVLAQAGEAIGLTILDHLIFADEQCRSLRRMGLL